MSTYGYCPACGEGIPSPTAREIIEDVWRCGHCGAQQEVNGDHHRDALIEMLDRIEALEE